MIDRLKKLFVLLGNVIRFVCIPIVWWISLLDQMLSPGQCREPTKNTPKGHSGHTRKSPRRVQR